MSVRVMSHYWESEQQGAKKLMLLAIADHCDDEGVAYPGVDRLAKKCSVCRRTAQRTLRQLEEEGELVIENNKGCDTKSGRTNRYYMMDYRVQIRAETAPSRGDNPVTARDDTDDTPLANGVTPTSPHGVTPTSPKPSVQPSVLKDCAPEVAPDPSQAFMYEDPIGPQPAPKSRKGKSPGPRTLIVCQESLNWRPSDALPLPDKTTVQRANKIVAWLNTNAKDVTNENPEKLEKFYAWYRKHYQGISPPADPGKFATHWHKFSPKYEDWIAKQRKEPQPLVDDYDPDEMMRRMMGAA